MYEQLAAAPSSVINFCNLLLKKCKEGSKSCHIFLKENIFNGLRELGTKIIVNVFVPFSIAVLQVYLRN
jgi:hypothetical protein